MLNFFRFQARQATLLPTLVCSFDHKHKGKGMAGVRFSAAVLWEGALRDDAKNDCEAD